MARTMSLPFFTAGSSLSSTLDGTPPEMLTFVVASRNVAFFSVIVRSPTSTVTGSASGVTPTSLPSTSTVAPVSLPAIVSGAVNCFRPSRTSFAVCFSSSDSEVSPSLSSWFSRATARE